MPRPKLYEEDCVELFFAPDASHPRRYFETELGPFGHFLDVAVDLDAHTSDATWSSGARIATTRDAAARTATIEVELTAPGIVAALTPGAKLPVALYRMGGQGPRGSTSRGVLPGPRSHDFHVPSAFGTMALDP